MIVASVFTRCPGPLDDPAVCNFQVRCCLVVSHVRHKHAASTLHAAGKDQSRMQQMNLAALVALVFPVSFLCFKAMVTKGCDSLVDPLYIYFINIDHSVDRRQQFLRSINLLPSHLRSVLRLRRVPAITSRDVAHMIKSGSLSLNRVDILATPNVSIEWWDKKYTAKEAACTLSHLKALRQAYLDGHESVLILEDDAVLTSNFLERGRAYANLAPLDWVILQWTTNNAAINSKKSYRSNDFWISWTGYHWSTIAYTIRREGIQRVLNHTSNMFHSRRKDKEPLQWCFDEENMLKADELVYFVAGKTYTSTYPWIFPSHFNSTISPDHSSWFDINQSEHESLIYDFSHKERYESIAVLMSTRISSAKDIDEEMHNLDADTQTLARFNPKSKWFVKVVLTSFDLLPIFRQSPLKGLSNLSNRNVEFQVDVSIERFNKFEFISEKLNAISDFDFVLLKDNDIRLAGFEWNTFIDANKHSIISGPYRQNIEGTTSRYKKIIHEKQNDPKTYVNLQNAAYFNTYQDEGFRTVSSIDVMTLEEFMVLMNSSFAVWFFGEILSTEFLSQDVDWGPDLMWCGAAYDYQQLNDMNLSQSQPCSLTSLNIKDMDKRQISKAKDVESYRTYVEKGNRVVNSFKRKNLLLEHWIDASERPVLRYRSLQEWCWLHSKKKRVGDCLGNYHNERVEKYIGVYHFE